MIIETSQLYWSRNVRIAVEHAYNAAVGQKKVYEDNRWEWVFRGRTLVLRDEIDKVLVWWDRFKSIGDVVANVDPVHIGLPWAGISTLSEVRKRQQDSCLQGGHRTNTVCSFVCVLVLRTNEQRVLVYISECTISLCSCALFMNKGVLYSRYIVVCSVYLGLLETLTLRSVPSPLG